MSRELQVWLGDERRAVDARRLIVAGWAGRDQASVQAHIHELEELGVPAPRATPLFYEVGVDCLTTGERVDVLGRESSGEAEAVLLAWEGRLWVGIGSDHTDRGAERIGVALSKQLCPKPLGRHFWPMDAVQDHWDQLQLRSFIEEGGQRVAYQADPVSTLLHPLDLVERYAGSKGLPEGALMFCGTVPVQGGIRPSAVFEMELHDPVAGKSLTHRYEARSLEVVS